MNDVVRPPAPLVYPIGAPICSCHACYKAQRQSSMCSQSSLFEEMLASYEESPEEIILPKARHGNRLDKASARIGEIGVDQ